jgi:dolichyl-diphosphooligosaccharide--protein glycosyltransferase
MSDDYREAYRWLWENTGVNERVMSWWDYGYQITSFGGRACHADGNTNNFTHIGIIGSTMASTEPTSWRLARMMEADYMLVVFGGASGYDGDDINKFMWMPKIANQTFTNISGDLYQRDWEMIVGPQMLPNMSQSMMFKFCYNNFKKFQFHPHVRKGTDIARQVEVPYLDIKLQHFEEAFTTQNWIIRIYRVLPDPLWDRVY